MTKRKLNYGMVGAGSIAQTYAQAFDKCDTAELVAIADTRVETACALADARAECRGYAAYETMAEEAGLDAVVVCTPPITHEEICLC